MFLDNVTPYELPPKEKERFLLAELGKVHAHHKQNCAPYARVAEDWRRHLGGDPLSTADMPFLPVTAFKEFELSSTSGPSLELRSSATTSGTASKVFADKVTRRRQSLSANKIWTDYVGATQRPYLVFDAKTVVSGTSGMSARGAAILSLAHLASEWHFVMRHDGDSLVLDDEALEVAMESIGTQPFMAYGFTYILYQSHCELRERSLVRESAHPDSVLIHSGGWKRLEAIAVDKQSMHEAVAGVWRLPASRVIDFYGVVEQAGIPYPDCEQGNKHIPYWANVIIRHSDSCQPAEPGEVGLIQLMNCLPLGAPNHSVLTEDLGRVEVEDGCPCGRRGRAFTFQGRAPRSELRGCSDAGVNRA